METAYLLTQNSNLEKIISSEKIDILYFGEGECEFNFLSYLRNSQFIEKLFSCQKKLCLISPHVSNISLRAFETFLTKYSSQIQERVSEFVINDFGVLALIFKIFKEQKKITFGNYMFHQQKDPLLLFSQRPNKNILTIDYDMYNNFFEEYAIENIEIYNPIHGLDIHNLEVGIYVYYPYVVQSVTRYCNRSLIYDNIPYSKIVDACSGCKGKESIKFEQDLLGIKLHSIGNKNIYSNFSLSYLQQETPQRIIYNYDIIK